MLKNLIRQLFGSNTAEAKFAEIKQGTVIDVRSSLEFKMGHHPQAINIPLNEISSKIKEIKAMQKPLLLCCASGARSGQATSYLKNEGIKEIKNCGPWTQVSA